MGQSCASFRSGCAVGLSRRGLLRMPGPLRPPFLIFLNTQLPRRAQRAGQHVFARRGKPYVRHAHASPTAMYRQEDVRHFFCKCGLLLWRELQISIALFCRGERGENSSAHAKVRIAHVRTFFGAFKTQSDAPKILQGHRTIFNRSTPRWANNITWLSICRGRKSYRPALIRWHELRF